MSPTAPSTTWPRSTGEVFPEFFRPASGATVSYEHLATALTQQIIELLKGGRIAPGDVL